MRSFGNVAVVRAVAAAMIAMVAAVVLSGCREEEQNRELHLEKGVYSGQPDTGLTDEQRDALKQRGRLQKF